MKSAVRFAGTMLLALVASAVTSTGANAQQHVTHSVSPQATSPEADKQAVRAAVTGFETAVAALDFDLADSHLTSDARWIEESEPVPAQPWPKWFHDAKAAGIHIEYRIRQMDVTLHGDTAWTTLTMDGIFTASNPAGRALLQNASVRKRTFVESEILVRTPSGWKIALGHTTTLADQHSSL